MARTMATCHPDTPMHAKGLCRLCYREKRREARRAARSGETTQEAAPTQDAPKAKAKAAPKEPKRRESPAERRQKALTPDVIELQRAQALVEEVDRLPAPEAAKRTGDDDVQHALRVIGDAKVRAGHASEAVAVPA